MRGRKFPKFPHCVSLCFPIFKLLLRMTLCQLQTQLESFLRQIKMKLHENFENISIVHIFDQIFIGVKNMNIKMISFQNTCTCFLKYFFICHFYWSVKKFQVGKYKINLCNSNSVSTIECFSLVQKLYSKWVFNLPKCCDVVKNQTWIKCSISFKMISCSWFFFSSFLGLVEKIIEIV